MSKHPTILPAADNLGKLTDGELRSFMRAAEQFISKATAEMIERRITEHGEALARKLAEQSNRELEAEHG